MFIDVRATMELLEETKRRAARLPSRALRWSVTDERMKLDVSRIIPGDWGKVGSGWLAQPLLSSDCKV
jgi:hypothetical protein